MGALDMHETAGSDYKKKVRDSFVWCAEHLDGWHHVRCCRVDGDKVTRVSRDELSSSVWGMLESEFVNKA
eukprot:NODE_1522_length_585_cov_215.055970_g1222_i0.p2 GENE.NODE_1522_length_585_cov_215.055970_g1222_i0~~NODE_1522_length_585_cov_215.055970_g1222_i0.p2  ORF type:complete len:80 (-),score=25.81 NODE_1522_length_585_cov_215.055970_g1222_i0:346-555(-)